VTKGHRIAGAAAVARLSLVVAVLFATACMRSGATGVTGAAAPRLRVVVPVASPPYAYDEGGQMVGLEIDFAAELAAALGRRLSVRGAEFGDVIPSIMAGEADLAMAGLTVTPAREAQMAFAEPYLRSGLLALVRREDSGLYPTPLSVVERGHAIGVVRGTTGERFIRERSPLSSVAAYPTALAAVDELRTRRIDAFLHDAPVAIWFASRDEANLAPILRLIGDEPLAWGMRLGDEELRTQVNAVLARWRSDGTRDRILARWLPYWQRLEAAERRP
jgi:ABC-type amino acid transport substrate-binding protein